MLAQDDNAELKHNLLKLNLICGLASSSGAVPYIALYGQRLGASLPQTLQIVSLATLLGVVVNAPAGHLSDRIGRKPIMVAGSGLLVCAMPIIAAAPNFTWFVVGFLIHSVGLSLAMGPDRALGVDTCSSLGVPLSQFTRSTVKHVAVFQAVGSLLGAVLVQLFGLRGPMFGQTAFYLAMMVAALMVVQPTVQHERIEPLLRLAWGLHRRPDLLWTTVFAGALTSLVGITFWLMPLCYARSTIKGMHLPLTIYGYIWSVVVLSPLLFSALHKKLDRLSPDSSLIVLLWVALVSLGGLASITSSVGLLAVFGLTFSRANWQPLLESRVMALASPTEQATISSLTQTVSAAALAGFLALAGWLIGHMGFSGGIINAAVAFDVVATIALMAMRASTRRAARKLTSPGPGPYDTRGAGPYICA